MTDTPRLPGEPPPNPHADRPNWRPATTFDAYLSNCREGVEQWSERRAAKLLGWSRIEIWRARRMAEIPADLFERLVALRPPVGTRTLAAVGILFAEGRPPLEVDRCPHCGGVVRKRLPWGDDVQTVIEEWALSTEPTDEQSTEDS